MKLGEDIQVSIGGELIALRPSLRNALTLARLPGSFPALLHQVQEGSLTAAVKILKPHWQGTFASAQIFEALDRLEGPLTEYVIACTGIDDSTKDGGKAQSKNVERIGFEEHLERLFMVATGWLGWTPDEAFEATPREIMLAYQGRIDLLQAIFGGSDSKSNLPDAKALEDRMKASLHILAPTIKAEPKWKRRKAAKRAA